MDLDMIQVINMKTITLSSIGLVITGTDHNDIDSEQILSTCLTWSWQANRFGKKLPLITWHSPDLGLHPYHRSLASLVLQQAANLARSKINQTLFGIWTTQASWCLDLSHSCVYQFLWFCFTLPSQSPMGPLTIFVLNMTLNYSIMSLTWH